MHLPLIILPLMVVASLFPLSYGYNILFMGPFPAPSHWLWLDNFVRELLNRGHHVTAVTNHRTKFPHPNYTEIIIDPMFDIPHHFPKKEIFELRYNSDFQNLNMWWTVGFLTSEHALNDRKVQKLIASKNLKFDLFVLEQFFHESFLMFAHKFNTPIITIGTMGYADNMDRTMGLLTPWSFVPHLLLPHKDNMTYIQRSYNTFLSIYDYVFRRWYYMPHMQAMAEKHFANHIPGELPSVLELEKKISLMLINSHRSMDIPRPSMQGIVNVGGVHIKPLKELPKDLKTFLDNSNQGVVYFSMGSYIKSTDLPQKKLDILLKAFAKLKQNVLWKFEDDRINNLPQNVMIKKWLPQNEVLAHRNVLLFISHGGLFGTQEAIHFGVPMLCIPLYGDQHRNTIKSIREGYALSMKFSNLTTDEVVTKVNLMLNDKKYTTNAKKLSVLFRDNPMPVMDEAMYWMEYIMRHKGAKFLKSHGVNLPFYEYLLLDVFAGYLIVIIAVLLTVYTLLKFTYKSLFKAGDNNLKKLN